MIPKLNTVVLWGMIVCCREAVWYMWRREWYWNRYCSEYFGVYCVWNVMAHAPKPDFVFRRKGRVHLNRRRCQFSRLLAAEVCASALVMLDTPCSEVVWRVLHSPVSPSLPLPWVSVCHHVSIGLYHRECHPQTLITHSFFTDLI